MPARHKKSTPGAKAAQLRIIGGQWRGRVLPFEPVDGLRPTGNRLRETLFNWLMPVIDGAVCLDAFAGSGALGLEALSRGAAHCTFVEANTAAASALEQNLQLLKSTEHKVVCAQVASVLTAAQPFSPYSVVFLDPPFAGDLWQSTADLIETSGVLADEAVIYVELPIHSDFVPPTSWHLHRQKQAGKVEYRLYITSKTS